MRLDLIPLGINGYYPSFGRQTSAYLLTGDRRAVLLDAGTGIGNLAAPPLRTILARYSALDIVFSHYHLDHVIGLFILPSLWDRGPVRLFCPAAPLLDVDTRAALDRLFRPPFASALGDRMEIVPVTGGEWRIGDLDFRFWRQDHPGGSVGMRIGDALAYTTDKTVELDHAAQVAGVDLLVHELWLTDEEAAAEPDERARHSSAGDVAEFARRAGVLRILPVHHRPARTAADITRLCRELEQRSGIPTLVPEEGRALSLA